MLGTAIAVWAIALIYEAVKAIRHHIRMKRKDSFYDPTSGDYLSLDGTSKSYKDGDKK